MQKKIWTLFLCLLLLNIVSFANAKSKFIGPNGGQLDVGHGCAFVVQPGAVGSMEEVVDAGQEAIEIFLDLKDYINSLEVIKNGDTPPADNDEWICKSFKDSICDELVQLKAKIEESEEHFAEENYEAAYEAIESVLKELGKVEEQLVRAESQGKISQSAVEKILYFTTNIVWELLAVQEALGLYITAESRWTKIEGNKILEFSFSPSGLVFPDDLPAMLIIPLSLLDGEEINGLAFYSSDGEFIEPIVLDFEIDEENGIIILCIPHFSLYYWPRR